MPSKRSPVIRVPKPPRSAFDKNRPASRLLLDQMIHLSSALMEHLRSLDNRNAANPVSEAQAAELVRFVTSILHPHTGPAAKRPRRKGRSRRG